MHGDCLEFAMAVPAFAIWCNDHQELFCHDPGDAGPEQSSVWQQPDVLPVGAAAGQPSPRANLPPTFKVCVVSRC